MTMIRAEILMITPHMIKELSLDLFSSQAHKEGVEVLSNSA